MDAADAHVMIMAAAMLNYSLSELQLERLPRCVSPAYHALVPKPRLIPGDQPTTNRRLKHLHGVNSPSAHGVHRECAC